MCILYLCNNRTSSWARETLPALLGGFTATFSPCRPEPPHTQPGLHPSVHMELRNATAPQAAKEEKEEEEEEIGPE